MFQSKRQWEKWPSAEIITWGLINGSKAIAVIISAGRLMGWEPVQAIFWVTLTVSITCGLFTRNLFFPLWRSSQGPELRRGERFTQGHWGASACNPVAPTCQPTASHEELRIFRVEGREGWEQAQFFPFDFPLEVSLPPCQNLSWQLLPTANHRPGTPRAQVGFPYVALCHHSVASHF